MGLLLDTIVPVFSLVGVGWLLAARSRVDPRSLADLALIVTSPALMFSVLSESTVDFSQWTELVGGTLWIVSGTAIVAVGYARAIGGGRRALILPAVFWNAGNLTLPLARLAFGPEGLQAAAVIFVVMAILNSSLGIWIAKGQGGLAEMLRMPLIYGSVGGLVLALSGVEFPRMVMEPIEMLGAMAIPLMLLNLGMQLRVLEVRDFRHSVVLVAIRSGGGLGLALVFVALFGLDGIERQVLLLGSIMPAAVINAVMAQRYENDAALVASSVALGTLVSLGTIPVMLYWLTS